MDAKQELPAENGKPTGRRPHTVRAKRTWAINRLSMVTALFTFVLIVIGALVTNNGAGNSVPDWPLAFGRLVPTLHLHGNVVYEYLHRVTAAVVAVLIFALFVWILFGERRGWVKWVGALAVVLLLAQGGLGGLRVHFAGENNSSIVMTHDFLAEVFLGVIVSLTVFTSPGWVRAGELRSGFPKASKPLVFFVATAATACLVIQLLLGAAYRRDLVGVYSHAAAEVVAAGLIVWAAVLVIRLESNRDRAFPYLARPARVGVWLLLFELADGILAYLFRGGHIGTGQESQPEVVTAVIHTGLAGALLAAEVLLIIRLYRMVPITERPK